MMLLALTLATAAQDPLPPKPADPNKITCKEQLKTGSRVNFVRVCHTAAEWELLRSENRKVIERAQGERGWYSLDPKPGQQ